MYSKRKISGIVLMVGIISFLIGAITGLVVLGWWLWPVQWVDADQEHLQREYKETYLRMAIDSYTLNQDLTYAKLQLENMGPEAIKILEDIEANPGKQKPVSIALFLLLAKGGDIPAIPITSIAEPTNTPQKEEVKKGDKSNIAPEPNKVDIKIDKNVDVPEDIMQQIGFFVAGGGGNPWGCPEDTMVGNPHWQGPRLGKEISVTERKASWCACGLGDEKLDVMVTLPNGEVQPINSFEIQEPNPEFSEQKCVRILYRFGFGSMLGTYQLTLTQAAQTISDNFMLVMPDQPQGAWTSEGAWFAGFKPGEEIRLLIYSVELDIENVYKINDDILYYYKFINEIWIEADQNGSLLAGFESGLTDNYELQVIAIDKNGNIASTNSYEISENFLDVDNDKAKYLVEYYTDTFVKKICGQYPTISLPPRLRLGEKAMVLQNNLSISPPYYESEGISSLSLHEVVNVIDGPVCREGFIDFHPDWIWKVKTQDGIEGWVVEADSSRYYLESIK